MSTSENRNAAHFDRRDTLRMGLLGAAALPLLTTGHALAARGDKQKSAPARQPAPAGAAKAKSVIQIWMWGGPCHLDTFDPKPDAGRDYCGGLDQAIETNVKGIRINAALPRLAKMADKYSIIRSMTHGNNGHETASYLVQTGHQPGRIVHPCLGAIVSRFKGYDAGYQGLVPPYVVLTQPQGRFSEAGFLGQKYKPFATGGDPARDPFVVEGIVAQGVSDERQVSRRELLHSLDSLGSNMPGNPAFARLDQCEQNAYGLMFGDARKLFDLTTEKDDVREGYGRNTFGQSCLMARRLVEAGVPYITINYQGWDTHKQHFEIMNRKLPEMDQAMAMLLTDLSDRGLLDSTVVWWGGEFGRTPKVQWNPPWNGGRSHFGQCFSTVLAGGGFKGGQVIGASDKTGSEPADRPVKPADMLASVCQLLGIDPYGPLPNDSGIDTPVLVASADTAGILREIM